MRIQLLAVVLAAVAMIAGSTSAGHTEGIETYISCLSGLKACASGLAASVAEPGVAAKQHAVSVCEAAVDHCAIAGIYGREDFSCDAWASGVLESGASTTR